VPKKPRTRQAAHSAVSQKVFASLTPAVDFYCSVNLGSFGLVLPDRFVLADADKASDAIKAVLKEYTFPSLNITYSASAPLQAKKDKYKIMTSLKEMELRLTVQPLGDKDAPLTDGCLILGIYPDDTTVVEKKPPIQVTPDLGALVTALGVGSPLAAIIPALGIALPGLFRSSFPVVSKAFIAEGLSFGWYSQAAEAVAQPEGVHYGVAILQVKRDRVKSLSVSYQIKSEWDDIGGKSYPDRPSPITLRLPEAEEPDTPTLTLARSTDDLPLTIVRSDVCDLLGITDDDLKALISIPGDPDPTKPLKAVGPDMKRITKGSLLRLLELKQD